MALVISDRVKETTVTTGTGTVTLAGAVTGFRAFGSVLSINDTTYYAIVSSSEFEVGIGTFTSSTTLTRDTVLSSSNSNLKVDFGAGSKNVFITQPADKAIYQDASGNVAGLNTDNVTEGSTNLYFTDERVDDRVGSLLVAGDNVTLSYNDAAGTLTISATEDNLSNNDTDDLAEGSTNLYYTSARANADFDTRLATKDTDDLSEGATNLYYTDARADARVNLQTGANLDLSSKSTSDLSEGTNLYYTNERVDDRVANLLQDGTGISFAYDDSNNVLTPTVTLSPFSTSNLSEGTNLYFTNERVDDRVANLLTAGSNITLTYDDTAGTLTIAGVEDDLSNNDTDDLSEGATNLYFTNERVDDRVSALVQNGTGISWSYNDVLGTLTPTVSLSAFSTSDLSEGTNLYYTTARFDSAFSGKSTSDLSEGTNLYYTTARFDTAFSGKDTDDLSEGASNLYYTDTRANAAIDARVTQSFVNALNVTAAGVQANSVALGTDTTGNYIATIAGTANKITVTGSGSESAAVTLTLPDDVQIANDLTVAGDLTVNGATTTLGTTNLEVSDNLFELNAGLTTAPVNDSGMLIQRGTSDNAIFMWDESADKFTLGTTTSDATVTGNIVITTGSLVANLEGNVTGNVTGTVSSLSNHDTGDLAEGTNLYYTDARSRAAISASGDISYNSSTGVISFTQATAPVTSVNTQTGAVVLDTDDISEGASNLYYTAARFNSAFAAKSTTDLSEGTNLYLTQERVEDYVGGMVSGNTETGIAVTYDDTLGKLNFVIDTLNQDTTGNAATATALETARNFSLTGDVTASAVSFDGTANVALSTSIAANTVGITELNVTDGTNGQVLTTDGAGNLSFSSAASAYGDSDVESYLDGGTSTPTFASATVSGDLTVDTNRLYVDSTNDRVGIALSTPPHRFSVGSANDDGIALYDGTNDLATIFRENSNQARFSLLDTGTVKVRLSSKPSDNNYINNGGNFGIGTDSPAEKLTISGTNSALRIDGGTSYTNTSQIILSNGRTKIDSEIIDQTANGDTAIKFSNRVSGTLAERMRLDHFANFLVGKTTHDNGATAGIELEPNGQLNVAVDGSFSRFNRLTSDGDVIDIRKDGTSVGTLAARIGDLVIGNNDVGLRFSDGGDSILPAQSGSTGDRDNAIDLGASGARFKDGYLGGDLLIGKTSLGIASDGFEFGAGVLAVTRNGGVPFVANRRTSDGDVISIRKDNTTVGVIGTQNWGIGTSSPDKLLHLEANNSGAAQNNTLRFTDTDTATQAGQVLGRIEFETADTSAAGVSAYIQAEALDIFGNTHLTFGTGTGSASEVMRLTQQGKVGIGTTSPRALLDIGGSESSSAVGDGNLVVKTTTTNNSAIVIQENSGTEQFALGVNVDGDFVVTNSGSTVPFVIQDSGNVGIATTDPTTYGVDDADNLVIGQGGAASGLTISTFNTATGTIAFTDQTNAATGRGFIEYAHSGDSMRFGTQSSERMRIDSGGDVLIGTTADIDVGSSSDTGHNLTPAGAAIHYRSGNTALYVGRQTNDGDLVSFRQAGSQEGTISVSGATVSYNGFSGTHESSGIPTDTEIGTVVSTIDELDTYTTGSKTGETRADHAKIKVSDVEGDARVYGVLSKFDENDKPVVASVGIGSVKVTGACNGGDLLESNGDGTAKVQSDDIIRSKTIGKVTIGNSDTGVKLVSCVLYCG
jgi:hypothetical protein